MKRTLLPVVCSIVALAALLVSARPAHATPAFPPELPNRVYTAAVIDGLAAPTGTLVPCISCHNNPDGGGGCMAVTGSAGNPYGKCWNPFGRDFNANGRLWTAALANMDSDGDGWTNGQELQNPGGNWTYLIDPDEPGNKACATAPGDPNKKPDKDNDGDGVCCIGIDTNHDGKCDQSAEHGGSNFAVYDCDDTNAAFSPNAVENCLGNGDRDCDGAVGIADSDCVQYVDNDGDGYCEVGKDLDADGYCLGGSEQLAPGDCDDTVTTVHPLAAEDCFDNRDNDCDGDIDLADADCSSPSARTDDDGDGYCEIGQNLNPGQDNDCADPGENMLAADCNDNDPNVNPGAVEICGDNLDNDCNGLPDLADSACDSVRDLDGDGYCAAGHNLNPSTDSDCLDPGEAGAPVDCDDTNPLAAPLHAEICDDNVDNDCNGLVSLADPQCASFIDGDGDGYCKLGRDLNHNGNCIDVGENLGDTDCDDSNAAIHPEALELCTDGLDNDCNGLPDALDAATCGSYVDGDHDGFCVTGQDLNGDYDCADANEQNGTTDCDDQNAAVFPTSPENCIDGVDNNCDGIIDLAQTSCTRDADADGDGYCAVGKDLNRDGDCLDKGENLKISDCDDGDPARHPDAKELCTNAIDDDCDGVVDLADKDCAYLLDRDHDSFCGQGNDVNGDGDCLDATEGTASMDCDDTNIKIFPGAHEICDDGIDNDCDGIIDVEDSDCDCMKDSLCDDHNPCTQDHCGDNHRGCVHEPLACKDAGMQADASTTKPDGSTTMNDDGGSAGSGAQRDGGSDADGGTAGLDTGCACSAIGARSASGWPRLAGVWLVLLLLGLRSVRRAHSRPWMQLTRVAFGWLVLAVLAAAGGCRVKPTEQQPNASLRDAGAQHHLPADAGGVLPMHDAEVMDASARDATVVDATISADATVADADVDSGPAKPLKPGLDALATNTTCVVWDPTMPSTFPTTLSATGCFDAATLAPLPMLIPFTPRAELWSDNAVKQRWLVLPDGGKIKLDAHGDFDLPIGTLLIKLFTVGGVKVETRFFMHQSDDEWRGYTFEWQADQTDATLLGQDPVNNPDDLAYLQNGKTLSNVGTPAQDWFIPSRNQCLQCHTTIAGRSLGLETAQLNSEIDYPATGRTANQLFTLASLGLFAKKLPDVSKLPALARPIGPAPLPERARAYLHSNCSFCHRDGGSPSCTGDFRYWIAEGDMGVCAIDPATPTGFPSGAKLFYPGNPSLSIMSLRIHAARANDGIRMPPLATSIIDTHDVNVLDAWIRSTKACK